MAMPQECIAEANAGDATVAVDAADAVGVTAPSFFVAAGKGKGKGSKGGGIRRAPPPSAKPKPQPKPAKKWPKVRTDGVFQLAQVARPSASAVVWTVRTEDESQAATKGVRKMSWSDGFTRVVRVVRQRLCQFHLVCTGCVFTVVPAHEAPHLHDEAKELIASALTYRDSLVTSKPDNGDLPCSLLLLRGTVVVGHVLISQARADWGVPQRTALEKLVIAAKWRGLGLGKALLQAGIALAVSEGVQTLWGVAANSDLAEWYKSLGAKPFWQHKLPRNVPVMLTFELPSTEEMAGWQERLLPTFVRWPRCAPLPGSNKLVARGSPLWTLLMGLRQWYEKQGVSHIAMPAHLLMVSLLGGARVAWGAVQYQLGAVPAALRLGCF